MESPSPNPRNAISAIFGAATRVSHPITLVAFSLAVAAVFGLLVNAVAGIAALLASALLLYLVLRYLTPQLAEVLLPSGPAYERIAEVAPNTPVASGRWYALASSDLTELEKTIFLHLYHRHDGADFGLTQRFRLEYFVDFLEAALVPEHLDVLSRELASFVRQSAGQAHLSSVSVALGPKRGNALLVNRVASGLGLQTAYVRERLLFDRWVEGIGIVQEPRRAILLDDISSDGEFLAQCVQRARDAKIELDSAFVIIDRAEGDALERLSEEGVVLHSILRLADDELSHLSNRARRSFS